MVYLDIFSKKQQYRRRTDGIVVFYSHRISAFSALGLYINIYGATTADKK